MHLDALENRTVDALTIEDIAALLPATMPIHYVKMDMQGLDGRIIMNMPSALLSRVRTIQFEAFNPQCTNLYEGQVACPQIAEYLNRKGFEGACNIGCEPTSTFRKNKITADAAHP